MGPFPEEGSASHAQYFTKGVKHGSCDLVNFPTAYSLYNRNDYKRCVCETWYPELDGCIKGEKVKQKEDDDQYDRKDRDESKSDRREDDDDEREKRQHDHHEVKEHYSTD